MEDIIKEIAIDKFLNNLVDKGLAQKDAEYIDKYIWDLQETIEALKSEINDLESQIDELEYEKEESDNKVNILEEKLENEISKRRDVVDKVQEIVDDQWKYSTIKYDTKEKILNRLDFVLRYC